MKRRSFFWATTILTSFVFAMTPNPLQSTFDFIIAGILPYSDISLGFLPSLGFIIFLLFIMRRWVRELRFQMLRRQALIANAESTIKELSTAHEQERTARRKKILAQTTASTHAH